MRALWWQVSAHTAHNEQGVYTQAQYHIRGQSQGCLNWFKACSVKKSSPESRKMVRKVLALPSASSNPPDTR
eukprot:1141849-Pelagomonas_calceolata.AAC.1